MQQDLTELQKVQVEVVVLRIITQRLLGHIALTKPSVERFLKVEFNFAGGDLGDWIWDANDEITEEELGRHGLQLLFQMHSCQRAV